MNIVMFVDKFYPFIGGVEKHTLKLAESLIEKGHNVTIITRNAEGSPSKETFNHINIIRINMKPKFTLLKIYFGILKDLKVILKADIIHFHDFSTFYYWFIPFRYIIFWKKYYITFHGWEGVIPPESKVIKIREKAERLTRGNICVGEYIEKWYGTKSTKIIYGATENVYLDIKKNENKIIYLGRLEHDTGILKYIEILKIIKESYNIDFDFEICGDGSLKEQILAELDFSNIKYSFNGFVKDPMEYLKKSTVCFTSGYLGIIEAMNCDNLVVSVYDNELKKDYLYMMPCSTEMIIGENNEILAEDISNNLQDKNLMNNKLKVAKRWAKKQSWDEVANRYLELWSL